MDPFNINCNHLKMLLAMKLMKTLLRCTTEDEFSQDCLILYIEKGLVVSIVFLNELHKLALKPTILFLIVGGNDS
jgi:hypothetical protein